ncbi:hypothetical protein AA309_05505 [Microvirga vignae]|uniref:Uncharacterized protein n=1 Tax=Microvirga vignae TaxID=1225564 RepID=A0A0H1RMR6_9HYPH|nr:hypothetical protein AA309_05505 [Microvirga vignae]
MLHREPSTDVNYRAWIISTDRNQIDESSLIKALSLTNPTSLNHIRGSGRTSIHRLRSRNLITPRQKLLINIALCITASPVVANLNIDDNLFTMLSRTPRCVIALQPLVISVIRVGTNREQFT